MKAFEWASASSVDEAVKLLKPVDAAADPDEQPHAMGGGQDLLTTMKEYLVRPSRVVNLKTIKGLDQIKVENGALRIGATATLVELEEHPEVNAKWKGLAEAAASIATPQIRNVGTVGGNLCQRPRCWYFRLENVQCRKKGGNVCYAIEGENKYNAIFNTGPSNIVHPSDLGTMLVALGATLTIAGPAGTRNMSVEEFFQPPSVNVRKENILKDGEIVTEIQVPAQAGKSTYIKFKERESLDFAMSAVGVSVELNGDKTVKSARVVLGGVASVPWRVADVEKFLTGKALNETTLAQAATMALEGATPLSKNAYKVPLTQALLKRALGRVIA
jgi:xanthine dehydrogenase YagS FAD-binding subunit